MSITKDQISAINNILDMELKQLNDEVTTDNQVEERFPINDKLKNLTAFTDNIFGNEILTSIQKHKNNDSQSDALLD